MLEKSTTNYIVRIGKFYIDEDKISHWNHDSHMRHMCISLYMYIAYHHDNACEMTCLSEKIVRLSFLCSKAILYI